SGHGGGGERATSRTCSRGGEVIAAIGPAMLSRMGASSEATPMSDILDYCEGQRVAHFDSGETIIPEGARLGKLFILIEGQIEVIRKDTQVTHMDEPGSVFGEMSMLLDMPHSATVKALSKV